MKKLWKEVKRLHNSNAVHKKKKRKLRDFTRCQILSHAAEEIVELMDDPENPVELADAFTCLIHYAIKEGWTPAQLEKLALKKLGERIQE